MQVLAVLLLACHLARVSRATTSFPLPAPLRLQVARRQQEAPPLPEREPTCAELRSMWRHMRRMGRQMEFTNEIPKLQDAFTESALRRPPYGPRRRPGRYPDPNPYSAAKTSVAAKERFFHSNAVPMDVSNSANEVVLDASNRLVGFHEFDGPSAVPGRILVPGRFSDTALPEESLGVYGTVVHSPEERANFREKSRRQPIEYGLSKYRSSYSDSTGLGRVPFRAKQPHSQYHYGSVLTMRHPLGGFAEFPQEVAQTAGGARVERIDTIPLAGRKLKNTCLRQQNRSCQTDVDCYCSSGNPKLFCGAGRCRPLFKQNKYGKQKWIKSWLPDSYEKNIVGYGPKRDPVWPGSF